jgi:hypothetical protein
LVPDVYIHFRVRVRAGSWLLYYSWPNPNPNYKNPLLFANGTTTMSETVFLGAKFRTVAKLLNCFICLKCNDFLKIVAKMCGKKKPKKSKMLQDFQTWFNVCMKKCIRI